MTPRRILVTGADGFIGRHLIRRLLAADCDVTAAVRREGSSFPRCRVVVVGDIGPETSWRDALAQVTAVVHLAGRAHVVDDGADEATENEYMRVNAAATEALARQGLAAGIRRFVFAGSVKAMGEASGDTPWSEISPCHPTDPYGRSKRDAERRLNALIADGLEPVILRLPLTYGPGVKANMAALIDHVRRGRPVPAPGSGNRRSFLFVGNLVDAILRCLDDDRAAGETFMISDGAPLSTGELARLIGAALGRPARIVPTPMIALRLAGWGGDALGALGVRFPFTSATVARLAGSAAVDDRKIRERLDWRPPYTPLAGMRVTVGADSWDDGE